ncbi:MAG: hypothetical protein JW982_08630 [Spirochaetes bacterium]|nr:hypothetical protein [Spirochaetota bacterium]
MKTIVILFFLAFSVQNDDPRLILFNDLHNLYIQWNDGFFGSKHFYRMLINEKLYKSIKSDIKTTDDYLWMNMDEEFRCVFRFSDWLIIRTILTEEQYKILHKENNHYRTWYRSDELFGIEGTIHNYSLDESVDREKVTLYLKNVRIIRYQKE